MEWSSCSSFTRPIELISLVAPSPSVLPIAVSPPFIFTSLLFLVFFSFPGPASSSTRVPSAIALTAFVCLLPLVSYGLLLTASSSPMPFSINRSDLCFSKE